MPGLSERVSGPLSFYSKITVDFPRLFDKLAVMNEQIGEYYAEWDEGSASYCVFHTDKEPQGHAYASFADEGQAEERAREMNAMASKVPAITKRLTASLRKQKAVTVIVKDADGMFSTTRTGAQFSAEFPDAYQYDSVREACKYAQIMFDRKGPLQVISGYGTIHERIATVPNDRR